MKTVILLPRCDIPFKDFNNGYVPSTAGPVTPLRQNWIDFCTSLHEWHWRHGDNVHTIQKALWQFDQHLIDSIDADILYIPHSEWHHLSHPNARYYMQTQFPTLFSIDKRGWGSNLSYLPINTTECSLAPEWVEKAFEIQQDIWLGNNNSKFEQPSLGDWPLKNYALFLCQIPHDLAIQWHSKVSVPDALKAFLEWSKWAEMPAVVKGHPVNPGSMALLKTITERYPHAIWVDNLSIHQAIANADLCFTVNSGAGFEVILHEKPLLIFGHAEYENVATKVDIACGDGGIDYPYDFDPYARKVFMYNYIQALYGAKGFGFDKLESLD